jgi:hypothetical protein
MIFISQPPEGSSNYGGPINTGGPSIVGRGLTSDDLRSWSEIWITVADLTLIYVYLSISSEICID